MLCAVIRLEKNAALPVSYAKRFAPHKLLRLRQSLVQMALAGQHATILIWSNVFIAVFAKRLVPLTRLLKARITNLRQRLAKNFIMTKTNSSLMAIGGSL